jgi:hypothetical protein
MRNKKGEEEGAEIFISIGGGGSEGRESGREGLSPCPFLVFLRPPPSSPPFPVITAYIVSMMNRGR